MNKKDLIPVLQTIVENLVKEEYNAVITAAAESRLSSLDIREAINYYPTSLSSPPADAYKNAVFIRIDKNTLHVDFDLWSKGIRSDLTLSCLFFKKTDNSIYYSIEDLHVM